MDEKDLKALVKEAKNCAKKKDWPGTLKAAKEVLRYEDNNYTALVLQGIALQETGKAAQGLELYKKAAKVKPNDLLCWQGIATYYEKSGDKTNPELLLAYDNIASISKTENNPNKYIETILKQAGVFRSKKEYSSCLNRLQSCIKSCGHFNSADQMVVEVIGEMKAELSVQEKELYIACLKHLHEAGSVKDEGYRKLFQIYYQSGQFQDLKSICLSLSSRFNTFYHPIDYLCRLYVEKHIELELSEVPVLVDKLFKLNPASRFGYFAKGRFLYESKKYVEAVSWLKEGIESKFHEDAAFLLIDSQLKIWDFVSAEDCCKTSKKAVKNLEKLNEYHCQALVGQRKYNEARSILPLIAVKKFANVVQCEILADEENWVEFDSVLEKLFGDYSWEVQYLKAIKSPEDLNDVCKVNNDNVDCLVKCGVHFMKLENYDSAALAFNQVLALSPSHPIALFNYGKLLKLDDNLDGAKNCFVKAYDGLRSPEIGSCLSDLYFEINDADSNKKLLLSATTENKKSRSKWASVRLGVLHLRLGEAGEAVIALQKALRTDFNDCDIWETLADAYYARGSYDSASKAYSKCIDLGADPVYPRLKIGVINGHLGLEELAIEALSGLGDYVPALVELSKIWLQVAEKRLKEGLDTAAIEAISEGLLVASRALKNDVKQEILPLKVISNLVISACSLNVNSEFKVPSYLVNPEQNIDLIEMVNLKSLILIGIRVVMTALPKSKSTTLSSILYSDLAKFYYYLATKCEVNCGDKAIYHGKKAVSLTPDDANAWNTLAIVAIDDKKLAQHCFIKSLTLNSVGNPIAWSNLGFLYLSAGHASKAYECFCYAQSIEPGYGRTWIGMGIVAEELDRTQAMDLFRHAATVPGTHEFAGFAYSEWLSHCLETEHKLKPYYFKSSNLETLSFAPDSTIIFNARSPTAESLNAEGIVSAHARLNSSAVESFTKAIELINNSKDLQIVHENLLVALVQNNQYEKVLEVVQNLKDTEQTFKCLAAAALALFKLHSFEASFAYYERALKFCTNPIEESDVLVGQGIVAYKLGDVETAKTLLFRGCQSKTNMANSEGYLALSALGLLTGELDLAAGALQEMKNLKEDRHLHDIALIESYCLISQAEEEPKPLRSILSKLYCYPYNGKLKKVLASHLINFHADGLTARKKLLSASVLGEKNELAAVAMTYLMEGDFNNAVKFAKSSLRMNLGDPASYSVLLASLVARGIANNSSADLKLSSVVKRIALSSQRCNDFPRLEEWFKTCEIVS